MVDRSEPLLDLRIRERVIYDPTLQMDWVVAQEWVNYHDEILQREFSELEHGTDLELQVMPGAPTGHPDAFSHHYALKREFFEKVYSAQKLRADAGELAEFNDFYGWEYTANINHRTELWTDTLVTRVVWQLMSKPTSEGTASDRVYLFNSEGVITSQQTLGELTSLDVNAGRLWGLRATSSVSGFDFEIRSSGGSIQATHERTDDCARQSPSEAGAVLGNPTAPSTTEVSGSDPYALTHPIIRVVAPSITRPYLEEEVINEITMLPELVPVIRVVEEVHLFLYGKYWIQEFGFINAFDQGWLVHPPNTSYNTRLKPPGKSYLSDDYNQEQGVFNPNAEWR